MLTAWKDAEVRAKLSKPARSGKALLLSWCPGQKLVTRSLLIRKAFESITILNRSA